MSVGALLQCLEDFSWWLRHARVKDAIIVAATVNTLTRMQATRTSRLAKAWVKPHRRDARHILINDDLVLDLDSLGDLRQRVLVAVLGKLDLHEFIEQRPTLLGAFLGVGKKIHAILGAASVAV